MKSPVHAIAFVLVLCACSKKTVPEAPDAGEDYFPLEKGRYVVYEADSTVYTEIPKDTVVTRFLLKERLGESFTDNEGQTAYRLERFVKVFDGQKPYDSMVWRIHDVWMVNAGRNSVQQLEGNTRYVKLVFPVEEQRQWDGNAYNAEGTRNYRYEYAGRPETVGNVSLQQVLKVGQRDYRTLISYESSHEKYARGVGLAARASTAIFSNTIVPGEPVENRIQKGYVYHQTIVAHGIE